MPQDQEKSGSDGFIDTLNGLIATLGKSNMELTKRLTLMELTKRPPNVLDEAINAAARSAANFGPGDLVQGGLTVAPGGNVLVVERFELPAITVCKDFLYRFTAPVQTIWQQGSISFALTCVAPKAEREFFLREWRKLFTDMNYSEEVLACSLAQRLMNIEQLEVHECEMVRKQQ